MGILYFLLYIILGVIFTAALFGGATKLGIQDKDLIMEEMDSIIGMVIFWPLVAAIFFLFLFVFIFLIVPFFAIYWSITGKLKENVETLIKEIKEDMSN